MKVVSSHQMSHIETLAYRDGASESEFMEEAGAGVALVVHDFVESHNIDRYVLLLCGKGNNAGDAYVAGSHLIELGYEVHAVQLTPIGECSPLCQGNHYRFISAGGMVREIASAEEMAFPSHGIIIDGLFGTGFKGKVKDPFAAIINMAVRSEVPIISVDIPSGLNGSTGQVEGPCIVARETAFLGLPKTGFFLRDAWNNVGKLRYVNFGLANDYIEASEADFVMLEEDEIKPLLPKVNRSRQKYSRGSVAALSGSAGMPGAAILSSWATLCGGAGIVHLYHPDGMQAELSGSPFEIIKVAYQKDQVESILKQMNKATACYIGPGIGRTLESRKIIDDIIPKIERPCVIDADALTMLGEKMVALPKETIMTPHHGEMMRLLGLTGNPIINQDFLKTCQEFVETYKVTLVLKGAPTFILHPGSIYHVNPTGDPGMATAGSGDVLTGLLAALLAQGLSCLDAAKVGVYLHGLAGEHAALELTSNCMLASDIIYHFPNAFLLKNL